MMNTSRLLLLIAATLFALGSDAALRSVTPDPYGGNTNCWQVKRHAEKLAEARRNPPAVVFIGDSITHGWESAGKDVWNRLLAGQPYRAINLGFNADRTEHVLWRLTEGGELDGYEAKCVLLMIGTNNSGHFMFAQEPPIDTILGIREILKVIRAKQPKAKIVLTAIFPRDNDDRGERCDERNRIVNKEIAKFADGKTIFWCDFREQFLTPDGRLPRELFPDLLHPDAFGYELWFAAVKPYLDHALSDGAIPSPGNRYAPFVRPETVRNREPATVYPVTRFSPGKLDGWWIDRLLEKRTQIAAAGGEIDVVLFGDSITHNWERSKHGGASLAELRKTYTVLDIGYSGDRTQHLVWRGLNGELDGYRAKAIVLMIGTNNGKDGAEDVALGVRKVLDVIAAKQPEATVILHPIFPRGKANDKLRAKNDRTNAIIRGYADGKRVIWCDFNAKLVDAKGDTKWIMGDRLHPNADGYSNAWLPAIAPLLKAACGK